MQYTSVRFWSVLGFLISVGALVSALFLQISYGWFPCPLCILQRYAYFITWVGFFAVSVCPCSRVVSKGFLFLTVLGLFAGASVAFYQVWILLNPLQTCGVDPMQHHLNTLPWVAYWPDMFTADGLCTEQYPPLLGLSLPMWSGLGFLAQGVLVLIVYKTLSSVWAISQSRGGRYSVNI